MAGLAVVAAGLAAGEMLRMFRARGVQVATWTVYWGSLAPVIVSSVPIVFPLAQNHATLGCGGWLGLGLALGLVVAFVGEMRRYAAPGQSIANVAHAALAVLYVGGLVGMLVQLRLAEAPADIGGLKGLFWLLALIATVKLSDICQYAIGRLLGRRKLAPLISPGKTWEGAIGGIGLATLIAAAGLATFTQGTEGLRVAHLLLCWGYALSVAVAGLTGDLAESLLKRDAGVKDSSDWLPGFGGVLDLLDSILLAAPLGYLWSVMGVIGGP